MIVTCPVCSTRYLVDPRALGSAGRLVRCANCSHTWQQAPAADAPRRVDLVAPQPELVAPAGRRGPPPGPSPPPPPPPAPPLPPPPPLGRLRPAPSRPGVAPRPLVG